MRPIVTKGVCLRITAKDLTMILALTALITDALCFPSANRLELFFQKRNGFCHISQLCYRKQYSNGLYHVNYLLKKIGAMLNLPIPLTMYVGRHSWASIAKNRNIPISVISEGRGHDSEATTQIYTSSNVIISFY